MQGEDKKGKENWGEREKKRIMAELVVTIEILLEMLASFKGTFGSRDLNVKKDRGHGGIRSMTLIWTVLWMVGKLKG